MKRALILGASGYVGRELVRLLARHRSLDLEACMSAREDEPATGASSEAGAPAIEPLSWARIEAADGVFLCTPHGVSAALAQRAIALGVKVVDLSADFRLKDAELYTRTYALPHPAPALLARAVYGLTEHARTALRSASLVANPGCYPTAVLLALRPLLERRLVRGESTVIADCKSGVSGAGKTPSTRTHFGSVYDNFQAYGIGEHRHAPEIEQEVRAVADVRVLFVPHLLPLFRGILATLYVEPASGVRASDVQGALREAYSNEPFVKVVEQGLPDLHAVQLTNECHIGAAQAGDRVVLVATLDNLLKGAAGQAMQNMNLMLGLDETEGLA